MCWKLGPRPRKTTIAPWVWGANRRQARAHSTHEAGHTHVCHSAQWTPHCSSCIEELVQLVQAVCSSIWLELPLEVVVYTLGVIVVNVLYLVLSRGSRRIQRWSMRAQLGADTHNTFFPELWAHPSRLLQGPAHPPLASGALCDTTTLANCPWWVQGIWQWTWRHMCRW